MSRWPLRKAFFWETSPFLRLLLPLVLGIVCYDVWDHFELNSAIVFIALSLSLVGMVLSGYQAERSEIQKQAFPISVGVFLFFLGWALYAANDQSKRNDYFGKQLDTNAVQMVRIVASRSTKATQRYEVAVLKDVSPDVKQISGKAFIYVYSRTSKEIYSLGDTLVIPAKWQALTNSANPFAFNNRDFQRRNNIAFQQFLSPNQILLTGKGDASKQNFIIKIHDFCDHQLARYVTQPAALGLLRAMLLGDEQGFDPELRQAYAQTGIIHIVSISGSHVAMMFFLISGILFWLRGKHAVWIKYFVGLIAVWLYVLVAGAPPSAVRSAVMFSIVALGIVSAREGQSLNTLMAAAFVLLIGKPQWLFALGFQLSFLAVLSILLFYQPLVRLWPQTTKLGKWLWQAVCVSFAAEVLIAPLVIFYFHNFPLAFVVANLVSSFVLGLCTLIGGLAVIALYWLPPIAAILGKIIGFMVTAFNQFILALQALNPHFLLYLQLSTLELILLYALIIAFAIWLVFKQPKAVLVASTLLVLLVGSITINKASVWQKRKLIVYNNGKQASVEILSGGYFYPLTSDAEESYNTRAAHTGFYSWKKATSEIHNSNYFQIAGKKVLVLKDSTANQFYGSLPVDILVLARPLRQMRVQTAFQAFQPKTIVLAQRASPYHLQRWHDSCITHQCQLYYVATDGAFMLN